MEVAIHSLVDCLYRKKTMTQEKNTRAKSAVVGKEKETRT